MIASILEKLIYSKCPNCKKHGLFFIKILTHGRNICECKCCHQKFLVHSLGTMFIMMIVFVIIHLLLKKILFQVIGEDDYKIVFYFIATIILYLGEYFAFMEELEEDKKDS